LIVHLLIDTQEAMGANLINTVAEGVAPLIEQLTGGKVYLRILSNLADRRLARASCRIPVPLLADFDLSGPEIADGIAQASRFARADPYRAATHNKGVMNGIDALAIATGQDWRAIEAGAHAFACREGQYRPLSNWYLEDGLLLGNLELPLALGTVGGPIKVHSGVQMALKLLRVSSVRELATIFDGRGPRSFGREDRQPDGQSRTRQSRQGERVFGAAFEGRSRHRYRLAPVRTRCFAPNKNGAPRVVRPWEGDSAGRA
jgi:hydroxymethylglutaryl-CoA reductase